MVQNVRRRRFSILGACLVYLTAAGCYRILESYFADINGRYGIAFMFTGYPKELTNVLNFNKDGTVRAETPDSMFGGTSPTKGTWSQDQDKIKMEFAGLNGPDPVQSTWNGVLKDKDGKEIKDGTWNSTYQIGSTVYPDSGTWTAVKK